MDQKKSYTYFYTKYMTMKMTDDLFWIYGAEAVRDYEQRKYLADVGYIYRFVRSNHEYPKLLIEKYGFVLA